MGDEKRVLSWPWKRTHSSFPLLVSSPPGLSLSCVLSGGRGENGFPVGFKENFSCGTNGCDCDSGSFFFFYGSRGGRETERTVTLARF